MKKRAYCGAVLLTMACVTAAADAADNLEATGDVNGVLTWRMGSLEAGKSARQVVLFAFGDSYEKLSKRLEAARGRFAEPPAPADAVADLPAQTDPLRAWIRNDATDFALSKNGFFWWSRGEVRRQSLTCPRGGQLSVFTYYVHYRCQDGAVKRAGIPCTAQGTLDNLRIVEPVHATSATEAMGVMETADGKLRLRVRAMMGEGAAVAVEFLVINRGDEPLADIRLTSYADFESAHDAGNDYCVLDCDTGGLLAVDPPTGMCVTMAGLDRPASGHVGTSPSNAQLVAGNGVAFEQWEPYHGLNRQRLQATAQAAVRESIYLPPLITDPTEPETRTLTSTEATEIIERDWLFQAEGKPLAERTAQEIRWARELAARLGEDPRTPDLGSELAELDALQKRLKATVGENPTAKTAEQLYLAVRRVKRQIMFRNPVLDFERLLFIDQPYAGGRFWWANPSLHGIFAMPGGRLLELDGLSPGGKIRKLAPEKPGAFGRFDLSFDGQRALFCFKPHEEKSFHLYEINVDGTGLRQLTDSDYDDLDPIYLPDGHLMFVSTRGNTYVRCGPWMASYILARCDADGSNVYLVSHGNEPDWTPALLHDGRVLYTRWEYTDTTLWHIQSLWTTNQDGTDTSVFWGNQSYWPNMLSYARPIPDSPRVMFCANGQHGWFTGTIGIVDPRQGLNFPSGLTKVTADVEWPEYGPPPVDPIESENYHSSGDFDAYMTPYPLSEQDFLVSARVTDEQYAGKSSTQNRNQKPFALYLMDVHGNRELIYRGAYNIWHAMPLRARARPPVHPNRVAWPGTGKHRQPSKPGTLYSADVYQGVPDLPRGSAKYLRVVQSDYKTYTSWHKTFRASGPGVSIVQEESVKRILGTVPVEADGSVYFEIPTGCAVHFQLLDEHYRCLQTMRSFTGVMPGEARGCIGCHETHSTAPPREPNLAQREASKLELPPWGEETISYERFAQPVLDQYCGKCHQGEGAARATLDLTLRPAHLFFKEPYLTLVGPAWATPIKDTGQAGYGIAGAIPVEVNSRKDPKSCDVLRPMQYLASGSKLIDIAMNGQQHCKVRMDPISLRRLIAWVDTNCPYRGEPEVRALPDPDFAGIDLIPIRPRIKSAPVIARP